MDFFQWQIPVIPNTPFGSPILVVLDCLRILVVVCGLLTVILTIPALIMSWTITQKYRLAALALFSVYVSLTEIQRIGYFANWRVILGAFCVIWALFSMVAFIQYEADSFRAPRWVKWLLKDGKAGRKSA